MTDRLPAHDLLSPAGIQAIGAVLDGLPGGFDLTSSDAHPSSISCTLRFDPARSGPLAQHAYLDAVLNASTVAGTLHRNLVEARRLLDLVVNEVDLSYATNAEVRAFLGDA